MDIKRGEVYICKLPKSSGSVQQSIRPCLVVSNNTGNLFAPTVTIIPLTTKNKTDLPTHYTIVPNKNLHIKPSTALCEQITTIDKSLLLNYKGQVTEGQLQEVCSCIKIALDLC